MIALSSALASLLGTPPDLLYGNVQGRVLDAWGAPAKGVEVRMLSRAEERLSMTDSVGTFLFSGIALRSDGADTARIRPGDGSVWPEAAVEVPPGALLAPRLVFSPGAWTSVVSGAPGLASGVRAGAARAAATSTPWPGPWTVFATREGLVGFTTANGHVIVQSDHFVALPSRRALNANDSTREFLVELAYGTRTVRVPVFDVGPWNEKDDWWHDTLRETWKDLPRGLPEAMAAFRDGYNGGLDGKGRKVANGAGIDLADGVFLGDLGMPDNAPIQVRLLWKLDAAPGDRVRLKQWANVRDSAGGRLVFKADSGEAGILAGAPRGGLAGSRWYLYWPVAWDRGVQGWVVENYLERADASGDAVRRSPADGPSPLRADALGATLWLTRSGTVVLERIATDGRILSRIRVEARAGETRIPLGRGVGFEIVRATTPEGGFLAGRIP